MIAYRSYPVKILKIKSCQQEWVFLDGKEKSVGDKLNTLPGFTRDGCEATCVENKYAYHKKCCKQFTNKTKIDRAKNRMKKKMFPLIVLNDTKD